MNKKAIILLAMMILMASMTTLETTARYRSAVVMSDRARVARPIIRMIPEDDFPQESDIYPGQTIVYGFAITNASVEWGVSEVSQTYRMEIVSDPVPEDRLNFTLFNTTGGIREPIFPDANGCFQGFSTLGTVSQTHSYQLEVSLPIEAGLPDVECPVHLDIRLTALQAD